MRGPVGALVNHVTIQCRDQGRLLEEASRDLDVFKKAYYKAERDTHDREARFEQEKQALYNEIHQLKVRLLPDHTPNVVSTFQATMGVYGNRLILIVPFPVPPFRQLRLVKSELWC